MPSIATKTQKARSSSVVITSPKMATKSNNSHEKLEQYINDEEKLPKILEKGAILYGKVVKAQKGEVLVDVGSKSEGIVSGRELKSEQIDTDSIKEGEKILVYVVNPEDEDGQLVLSIRRTGQARRWLQLEDAKEKDDIVEVEVMESNSGGLIVSLGEGIRGFIPTSQLDASRVYTTGQRLAGRDITFNTQEKLSSLIGKTIKVRIIEIDREKNRIILSEKHVTQERDIEMREKTLGRVKINDILEGEVSGIVPFGIFVNAEGLEGLVHLSEISWDKVDDVGSLYKIGDKIKVQVIAIEDDGKRIAYSIKRLQDDTWADEVAKYKVGEFVDGEVQKIVDYGAFVRIGESLNGLIHISELSDGLVADPSKILTPGQKVKVKILSISPTERHLGLSLKRAEDMKAKTVKPKKEEAVKKQRKIVRATKKEVKKEVKKGSKTGVKTKESPKAKNKSGSKKQK